VSWWYFDEGRRFALEAELPASAGAKVARTLDRLAGELPQMPDADPENLVEQRRADALVLLCGGAKPTATDDADRTTVVIHTKAASDGSIANGQTEGGGVVPSRSLERLLCNSRVQVVEEDEAGNVLALGRLTRIPSGWMARQVRYRDQECRFPGCGAKRFTEAHHIVWWSRGGRTDLENLLLICSFHHKLVHEHGWVVKRAPDGDRDGSDPTARGTGLVQTASRSPLEPGDPAGRLGRVEGLPTQRALPTGTLLAILLALTTEEC
jgi:hypothetical protein